MRCDSCDRLAAKEADRRTSHPIEPDQERIVETYKQGQHITSNQRVTSERSRPHRIHFMQFPASLAMKLFHIRRQLDYSQCKQPKLKRTNENNHDGNKNNNKIAMLQILPREKIEVL